MTTTNIICFKKDDKNTVSKYASNQNLFFASHTLTLSPFVFCISQATCTQDFQALLLRLPMDVLPASLRSPPATSPTLQVWNCYILPLGTQRPIIISAFEFLSYKIYRSSSRRMQCRVTNTKLIDGLFVTFLIISGLDTFWISRSGYSSRG